jgi:DNA-binding response OmpR family regulator
MPRLRHIAVLGERADLQDMVRVFLVQQGFRVSLVGNLDALHGLLRRRSLDAVVLDAPLRGSATQPLALELRRAGVPVLVLSGSAAELGALEDDGWPVLAKPFRLEALRNVLDAVLADAHEPDDSRLH